MVEPYTGPLLAATRDASAYDRPNTRSPKKLHVAVKVQRITGTGTSFWDGPQGFLVGEAACDPMRIPLDMSVASPVERAPAARRCRRRGCAALWPTTGQGS